ACSVTRGDSWPCNRPSISSFNRTLGGTLFMALISSGPATNGAHGFESPGGYQRLFAFTGSLGHHQRVIAIALKPYDFGADKLKATQAPFLFIHGDADGVRLDHIAEMFRLKGDEIHGDLRPRSESRLAVLPNTTHVTLMEKADAIIPIINDFLDATSQEQ